MRVYNIYDYIQFGLDVFVLAGQIAILGVLVYLIGKEIVSYKPQK